MTEILHPTSSFDFTKINMISPACIPGGNYFIKFRKNDEPIYIQTPTCKVKQGFIKSGKKMFCDLMFTHENEEFIYWMENLENHSQKMIFENKTKWFETDLDEHDIENFFTSPLKIFKSGKYYSCRINVPTIMGNCNLKIYDEKEINVDIEKIQENTNVIAILEIQGIKCSARNFQIEMEVKQMMMLEPKNLFEKCILKKSSNYESEPIQKNSSLEYNLEVPENKKVESTIEYHTQPHVDLQQEESYHRESPDTDLQQHTELQTESLQEQSQLESLQEDTIKSSEMNMNNDESVVQLSINEDDPTILEIDFDLEKLSEKDTFNIRERNDIYYKLYKDAKQKAKQARDLALSSYLEAKRIKNTYLLDNVDDSESDLDEESFENY